MKSWWGWLFVSIMLVGCGQKPPPVDEATKEQQLKELQEQRQREWGNK